MPRIVPSSTQSGFRMRLDYDGVHYVYVERGRVGMLRADNVVVWWGDVDKGIPPEAAPVEVLLHLSLSRKKFLT